MKQLGFRPLPITPGEKSPFWAIGRDGEGRHWQRYSDTLITDLTIHIWSHNPTFKDCGVGLALGHIVPDLDYIVIAVDIDSYDSMVVESLRGALPPANMSKRGRKGFTAFYLADSNLETRQFYGHDGQLIAEILSRKRQTVCPPSIHPSGCTYQWGREPVPVTDLSYLGPDELTVFYEMLEVVGWNKAAAPGPRVPRGTCEADSIWSGTNTDALANLDAWCPLLGLPKLRRLRNGNFEGVAVWRSSNTGRPLSARKANLKFHERGIKDMGADRGYSPIDICMYAFNLSKGSALAWLRERLGFDDGQDLVIVCKRKEGAA